MDDVWSKMRLSKQLNHRYLVGEVSQLPFKKSADMLYKKRSDDAHSVVSFPSSRLFENRLLELLHELSLVNYLKMPPTFKTRVAPGNRLLPYYMTLLQFSDHLELPERHRQAWLHVSGCALACP